MGSEHDSIAFCKMPTLGTKEPSFLLYINVLHSFMLMTILAHHGYLGLIYSIQAHLDIAFVELYFLHTKDSLFWGGSGEFEKDTCGQNYTIA